MKNLNASHNSASPRPLIQTAGYDSKMLGEGVRLSHMHGVGGRGQLHFVRFAPYAGLFLAKL